MKHKTIRLPIFFFFGWIAVSYLLLPVILRLVIRHPALSETPQFSLTVTGLHGDPINICLIGTEADIQKAMLAAKWFPADPLTLKSSLRISADVIFHRAYDTAPVSSLYLWGRKQDLAFEQPHGKDPSRRHHVRFWKSDKVDMDGLPLWAGSATFDTCVGFSHTTGQITHHIAPDVDAERDKLIFDLNLPIQWIENFQDHLQGHNGGGDLYHTDGRLPIVVLLQ